MAAFIIVPHQIARIVPSVVSMAVHAAQFTFLAFSENPHTASSRLCSLPFSIFALPIIIFFYLQVDELLAKHKPFPFPAAQ